MNLPLHLQNGAGIASTDLESGPSVNILHVGIVSSKAENAKVKNDAIVKKRGRVAAAQPHKRHFEILRAIRTQTYEKVGDAFGVSRQRVGQIVRRWKQYSPVRPLPAPKRLSKERADLLPVEKENRIHVVSFRLTESEVELLRIRYPEMKSIDRAARKIVTKFLSL